MYSYVTMLLLFVANTSFAGQQCQILDIAGFYAYIKKNGPIKQETEKQKLQIASGVNVAEQRPNPQLDFNYLKGTQFGLDINNYSISLKHIIEYGGKRDRRIDKAISYKNLKENEVELNFYQENLHAISSFQRVAQLEIIIKAVKEAIHTFEKITSKLASRSSLTPEETVALSTLQLASSDYTAQLNDLQNEKTILVGRISFLANCENLKPTYKSFNFKNLNDKTLNRSKSGLIQLEELKVSLAHKELEVQKSLGYSNISVRPSFEYQTQGKNEFQSLGVSVSFSFPIFHTNDGGKLEALRAMHTQKLSSTNIKNMLRIQRQRLIEKYQRSLNTLHSIPDLDVLERKHQKVEKLFSRGVVSIQMTIESHRQQIEFLKSRFETENDVLDTLGKISMIDGNLDEFDVLFKRKY